MSLIRLLLCAALAVASTGVGAQDGFPGDDGDGGPDPAQLEAAASASAAWQQRAAEQSAARGGARDLAIAALLMRAAGTADSAGGAPPDDDTPSREVPVDPRVATWQAQASAKAGSDVIANALLAGSANDRAAIARWRSAEPDNMAPLLFGSEPVESLLSNAARAARVDMHYYDQTRAIAATIIRYPPTTAERAAMVPEDPPPADELALVFAGALLNAFAMPPLQQLVTACRDRALDAAPDRRSTCQRIAETLRDRSDTLIGESLGLGMMRRMAETPAEIAAADARGRQYAWRLKQWQDIAARQPRGGMAEMARLVADPSMQRESDLIDRVITGAGAALTPPAGWQPSRPR